MRKFKPHAADHKTVLYDPQCIRLTGCRIITEQNGIKGNPDIAGFITCQIAGPGILIKSLQSRPEIIGSPVIHVNRSAVGQNPDIVQPVCHYF